MLAEANKFWGFETLTALVLPVQKFLLWLPVLIPSFLVEATIFSELKKNHPNLFYHVLPHAINTSLKIMKD